MRYSAQTRLAPPDVLKRAVSTFGPAGLGLRLRDRDLLSARFDDHIGHIGIEVRRHSGGDTEVIVETMQYDNEVVAFIQALPRWSLIRALLNKVRW